MFVGPHRGQDGLVPQPVAADAIDHSVGLTDVCQVGDAIDDGRPLAMIHAADEAAAAAAGAELKRAIRVEDGAPRTTPVVLERIDAP